MDKNKCSIQNCSLPVRCKKLCDKHYQASRHKSNPEKNRLRDKQPLRRFKKFINYCKRKEIPTDIDYNFWLNLIESDKCYYCAAKLPTNGFAMDRKQPDIGYFKINVVPCCEVCNFTKRDQFSHVEFKVIMEALTKFREQNGRK